MNGANFGMMQNECHSSAMPAKKGMRCHSSQWLRSHRNQRSNRNQPAVKQSQVAILALHQGFPLHTTPLYITASLVPTLQLQEPGTRWLNSPLVQTCCTPRHYAQFPLPLASAPVQALLYGGGLSQALELAPQGLKVNSKGADDHRRVLADRGERQQSKSESHYWLLGVFFILGGRDLGGRRLNCSQTDTAQHPAPG